MMGKSMIKHRNELVEQINDSSLTVEEAKKSLAGWLLKYWEENGYPVLGGNQTYQENAYYNASSSIESSIEMGLD